MSREMKNEWLPELRMGYARVKEQKHYLRRCARTMDN
jgi:hypothetical protein